MTAITIKRNETIAKSLALMESLVSTKMVSGRKYP
jgi:hypothetical protein